MPEMPPSGQIAQWLREGAKLSLLCYHCDEVPCLELPFGAGFPQTPFTCVHCGVLVISADDLKYSLTKA